MSNFKQIRRGEIYTADMPECFGSEQGGFRLVLVLQNEMGNIHSPTTIIAPLTSKLHKRTIPTHVLLNAAEFDLDYDSIVLLEQIRVVDKTRLRRCVTRIDDTTMESVENAICISLGFAKSAA